MLIFKRSADLRAYLLPHRLPGQTIGFVPTMGALHEGHLSLIRRSLEENSLTVCSIFVNPTQFNDPKDLEKYPRPIEHDIALLQKAGCDILYLPDNQDVYGGAARVTETFDLGGLDTRLEGASRPGHFAGVAQVVKLLLTAVEPHKLYLGQKDYQQLLILKRLVSGLQLPMEVVMCPIFREENGLAMSSRNIRLSPELRSRAGAIYQTLQTAAAAITQQPVAAIESAAKQTLNALEDFHVDYFEVLNAETLQPIDKILPGKPIIIITSVIVGGVRLLDNLLVG